MIIGVDGDIGVGKTSVSMLVSETSKYVDFYDFLYKLYKENHDFQLYMSSFIFVHEKVYIVDRVYFKQLLYTLDPYLFFNILNVAYLYYSDYLLELHKDYNVILAEAPFLVCIEQSSNIFDKVILIGAANHISNLRNSNNYNFITTKNITKINDTIPMILCNDNLYDIININNTVNVLDTQTKERLRKRLISNIYT